MQFESQAANDFLGFDDSNSTAGAQTHFQIASLSDAILLLEEVIQSDAGQDQVMDFAQLLWQLAEIIERADLQHSNLGTPDEISDAVIAGAGVIRAVLSGQSDAAGDLQESHAEISARFGPELTNLDHAAAGEVDLDQDGSWLGDGELADEPELPSAAEVQSLLQQLTTAESDIPKWQGASHRSRSPLPEASAHALKQSDQDRTEEEIGAEQIDSELRDAFMDDAMRCLASMESSLLSLEANAKDPEPLQMLGRELHTLKGASASIGLGRLADYIHSVEDAIGEIQQRDQPPPLEALLEYVDTIRERVNRFQNQGATGPSPPTTVADKKEFQHPASPQQAPAARELSFDDGAGDDETVRVKASRLNRLMDMLSELLMSRNRRDSELSRLISIHEDLLDNVSRIRTLNLETDPLRSPPQSLAVKDFASADESGALLGEIANDVMESAQRLRECYQSVADGNNHVSQFIRGFRQELVELRRTPISGLFHRLRRAVSDAARSEGKQVQLKLAGEETGIERSIQSRLFEPLLHIVRNSVSHGIESAHDRLAVGKPPQGTITFEAITGPDLLVIEVRDDGGGLDYEAIRRRGMERGLITAETSSHRELAQLIFHPCFSTRDSANQVSGRGVGMDVVAATLERMCGWVEVDSSAGHGTTIRLSIPLPSMVQHVMVFRSAGQLFAVPMQAVQSAGDQDEKLHAVCLDQLLELQSPSGGGQEMVVLGQATPIATGNAPPAKIAILIDEIIGPEEVVIRPLPKLFRQHPVCVGATLSGLGEVVLLLDANRLSQAAELLEGSIAAKPNAAPRQHKVLVVDDSAAARMRVIQSLNKYPVQIVQSGNGRDALQIFQSGSFDVVFSDIEMPRMTGLQLLAEIKRHPIGQHTPVVLVSSRTEDTIRREAIRLGAMACLEKPLTAAAVDSVWPKISLIR